MRKANHPELERQELPKPYWDRQQVLEGAANRIEMAGSRYVDLKNEQLAAQALRNEQAAVSAIQAVQTESRIGGALVEDTLNNVDAALENVRLVQAEQPNVDPMKEHRNNDQPTDNDPARNYFSVN